MADLTPAQELRLARELIADPCRWTKAGFYAENKHGWSVQPHDPVAHRFCAYGALMRIRNAGPAQPNWVGCEAAEFLTRAAEGNRSVVEINDQGTHEDVLRLYDRAIRLAEAAEAKDQAA